MTTPKHPRSSWGARQPRGPLTRLRRPLRLGYQHHDAGPLPANLAEALDAVQADQRYHQDARRYLDVAYNELDSPTGDRIDGRGADWQGGATYGENRDSLARCALGNYDVHDVTPELLDAIADGWAEWVREGRLDRRFWMLRGHRDSTHAATACPGRFLYTKLPLIRAMIAARLDHLTGDDPMSAEDRQAIIDAIAASLDQLAVSILELDVRTQAPWPLVQLPGNATQYVMQTGDGGVPTLLVLPGPAVRDALIASGYCEPIPRTITDDDQAAALDRLPKVRYPGY